MNNDLDSDSLGLESVQEYQQAEERAREEAEEKARKEAEVSKSSGI
jgi:hypothetical protein